MTKANSRIMRNLVRKLGREEGLREFYDRMNPKSLGAEKSKPQKPKEPKGESKATADKAL